MFYKKYLFTKCPNVTASLLPSIGICLYWDMLGATAERFLVMDRPICLEERLPLKDKPLRVEAP